MRPVIGVVIAICFLNLSVSSICRAIEITDCGSKVGKFISVDLKGCDANQPVCYLIRNTNASIAIDFTTYKDVSKVTAVVHGIVMDVPIPFPLPRANACENSDSGIHCPLTKDTTYKYQTTLPVLKSYPQLSVIVKWELKDENNDDIVCALIPAKVK